MTTIEQEAELCVGELYRDEDGHEVCLAGHRAAQARVAACLCGLGDPAGVCELVLVLAGG